MQDMTNDRTLEILGQTLTVVAAIDRHRDQAELANRPKEVEAMECLAEGVRAMALDLTSMVISERVLLPAQLERMVT